MDTAGNLSKNILAIRRARRLSQEEFSRELCIARSTLQQIEKGHRPTLATLSCMARRLNCSVSDLLKDCPSPSASFCPASPEKVHWFAALSPGEQDRFLHLLTQLLALVEPYQK